MYYLTWYRQDLYIWEDDPLNNANYTIVMALTNNRYHVPWSRKNDTLNPHKVVATGKDIDYLLDMAALDAL